MSGASLAEVDARLPAHDGTELFRELNVVNINGSSHVRIDQIVQQVILRFPYLRNDHAISLKRFIDEHERAPFSGRNDALGTLDSWLFDNNSLPNLLLCGPGGRGKSALLVQWLAALRRRSEPIPGIIFLPVSRRHELSKDFDFFPALAASLASFLPEAVTFPDEVEHMRAFAQRAFERLAEAQIPLLVIIDGLDEADAWSIGPTYLPDRQCGHTLRIVASARSAMDDFSGQQWLRRLGWDTNACVLSLDKLGDDAVQELLAAATEVPQPDDVLRDMVAYCRGDPLVTQILIQQIKANRFDFARVGVAEAITDPLGRVLKTWYEQALTSSPEAGRLELHQLVGALVKAKGPLTRADLAVVMGAGIGQVDLALQSFKTLLVGSVDEGYSFAHPRMAEILGAFIGVDDQPLNDGFIQLTTSALGKATTGPTAVPLYPLRHAATHLREAAASSQVMQALLSASWLKAHLARLGHVRGFLELADAIVHCERVGNQRTVLNGDVGLNLEFAGTLWRAVAVESLNLRFGRDSRIVEDQSVVLDEIREALRPTAMPSFTDFGAHLRTLVEMRHQLHPVLAEQHESLLMAAGDVVINALFTYQVFDDRAAVELLQAVRHEFEVEAYIHSITENDRRLTAWWYLIDSGRAFDRDTVFRQATQLLQSTTSLELKAEISVFLAYANEMTFERAYSSLLSLAQLDYISAKSAVAMAVKLMGGQSAPRSVVELDAILHRLRVSAPHDGIEAPLLGASLCCCAREQRCLLWHNLWQLESWRDVQTVVEQGPDDWTFEEIEAFINELGGRISPPTETDSSVAPFAGWGQPSWQQGLDVAAVLAVITLRAENVMARRRAMSGVLDNLETIPIAEWWSQPAEVLGKVLALMRYDIASTDDIKRRASLLADGYEAQSNEPLTTSGLSSYYALSVDACVEEAVMRVNKWDDQFLEQLKNYALNDAAIGVALSEVILTERIRSLEHRAAIAQALIENVGVDQTTRKLLEREFNITDVVEQRRQDWVRRDREAFCHLLNGFAVTDSSVSTRTIRWLLEAGSEAHALLSVPAILPGWSVPADLVNALTLIAKHWSDLHTDDAFPASLAARLPLPQILEIVEALLAKKVDEPPFVAWDVLNLLSAIEDVEIAATVENSYLEVVSNENFPNWYSTYEWFSWAQNLLSVVHLPDKWLACRLTHLALDYQDLPGIVSQIAHETIRQPHPNVRQRFSQWALENVSAISDPIERASIRIDLGGRPQADEFQAARDLLFRVLDGSESMDTLIPALPVLIAGDEQRSLSDPIACAVASSDQKCFERVIEALGEGITQAHVRATLTLALEAVTYTGSPTPRSSYFGWLPDDERNAEFRAWRSELKARGVVEDERRFISRIADVATSQFAYEVLQNLLLPDVDCLFWRDIIVGLLARLTPEHADALVGPIMRVAQAEDEEWFAMALMVRMTPRNRKALFTTSMAGLNATSANTLRSLFCRDYPELLDSKVIGEALQAAENDAVADLSWVLSAPAATPKLRYQAWTVLLDRMKDSGLANTTSALTSALPLLNALGSHHQAMIDCTFACVFALEQQFSDEAPS